MDLQASIGRSKLGGLGLGAVGSAVAFALATVLARMLAAALSFTVVLAFAGVFCRIGRGLCDQYAGGGCGRAGVGWLCVKAGGGSAEKTGKCSGESERFRSVHHRR